MIELFLESYYPNLELIIENKNRDCKVFNPIYSIYDKKKEKIILDKVTFRILKKYIEDNLYFMKIFVELNKSLVLDMWLQYCSNYSINLEKNTYVISQKYPSISIIQKFNTQKEKDEWIINLPEFSLKELLPYICPKCGNLRKKIIFKDNATIHRCIYCGEEIVEIL